MLQMMGVIVMMPVLAGTNVSLLHGIGEVIRMVREPDDAAVLRDPIAPRPAVGEPDGADLVTDLGDTFRIVLRP